MTAGKEHQASDLIRDGIFQRACADEHLPVDSAAAEVEAGHAVFLCSEASRAQMEFRPLIIGGSSRKKIAALIGLGPRDTDREAILRSISVILAARPDAIMDLTTNPSGVALRAELKDLVGVPLGACLTYDLFTDFRTPLTRSDFAERFEAGLATGIDFVLLHMGMNQRVIEQMQKSQRTMPTTSRGGGLISRYMIHHKRENPLIEYFDEILALCRKYGVVLDTGDIFRPGCIEDAGDDLKWAEIELIAELRETARASGVQVLCEAGGHIPLDKIPELIPQYKAALGGAPLWLAGPMVVDTAVTLDSIVNTLGAYTAAEHGGDMFASITQNEHYAMPTAPETAEAVRNVRVAIEAHDVARRWEPVMQRNLEMGRARRRNAWQDQASHSLYPDLSNQVFLQHDLLTDGKPCTICGIYCPHIVVKKDQKNGGSREASDANSESDLAPADEARQA